MSVTTWVVVYNSSENTQVVDEDGRSCYPYDFTWARRSFVKDLIDREIFILPEIDGITNESTAAARLAKEEVQKRNDEIDAEKAKTEAPAAKPTPPKTAKSSN